jgi:hypothetical protein
MYRQMWTLIELRVESGQLTVGNVPNLKVIGYLDRLLSNLRLPTSDLNPFLINFPQYPTLSLFLPKKWHIN